MIDPTLPSTHYLCYSDIRFARSQDSGHSWHHNPPSAPHAAATPDYNTVYAVALDPTTPGRIWAPCSDQHDIPYGNWLWVRSGGG